MSVTPLPPDHFERLEQVERDWRMELANAVADAAMRKLMWIVFGTAALGYVIGFVVAEFLCWTNHHATALL